MVFDTINHSMPSGFHLNGMRLVICWLTALLIAVNSPLPAQPVDEPEASVEEDMISEEEAISSEDLALRIAEEADSLWNVWMSTEWGKRTYYFRRSFEIQYEPAGGKIMLTADDNWSLYINGNAIQYDTEDELDWSEVTEIDISKYLVVGKNTVTIQVDDIDNTQHGLIVGIEYSTIPDLESKLIVMEQEALAEQRKYQEVSIQRQEAERALQESQQSPLTEAEMHEIRSIEKNKLD
ncbi:hypothetical protein HQ587_07735 [bacterium]|nr:hypothetical protein [bacterium]